MSSAMVLTSAARERPFILDDEAVPEVCRLSSGSALKKPFSLILPHQSAIKNQPSKIPPASVIPASRLAIRPAPEMVSSGIVHIDALTGGLPRGCLTEICGPASSGRTTLLLSAASAATQRGEFCAIVDAGDVLDPHSAAAAGIELERLLWVRCGGENSDHAEPPYPKPHYAEKRLEQLLRATDLLLESGGFGLIALDLADVTPQAARRIPLTTWFRFRRAVEHTPTVLLAIERQSIAGSCSSLLIKLGTAGIQSFADANDKLLDLELAAKRRHSLAPDVRPGYTAKSETSLLWDGTSFQAHSQPNIICVDRQTAVQFPNPTHTQLLTELKITAEIVRSRMDRKPTRSAEITFASKTAWAG